MKPLAPAQDPEHAATDQGPVVEPVADIRRAETGWIIDLELPGVEPADVSVDLDRDLLLVRAPRVVAFDADKPDRSVEFVTLTYQRTFRLGRDLRRDAIVAACKRGLLRLELPFLPEVAPRKIAVTTTEG